MILKEYIDEVTYDVVPMDCTSVLLGVPFLIDRKATLIPYLGKCEMIKYGQNFILRMVIIPNFTWFLV